MGMARAALLGVEGFAWMSVVGIMVWGSSVGITMGGSGPFSAPSMSGLGSLPVVKIVIVSVVFLFFMLLTSRVAP